MKVERRVFGNGLEGLVAEGLMQQLSQFRDWDAVEAEVVRIVSMSIQPFATDTVSNTRDLIAICRLKCPVPAAVQKGYWSTVSLSWSQFEIEVFEDRLEVYHFFDRNTDIWDEYHVPGKPFSQRFLRELPILPP